MKKTIAAATLAAVALVPATADARKSKVYRGNFALVGADGDYTTGKFGKAHLVDGKRNDKLSVHIRRVSGRSTWTFKLQQGSCGGAEVPGWTYRRLKTSRKGVGNSWARSRTFTAVAGTRYFVAVYDANGELALCARLSTSGKAYPKANDKSRGKSDDKSRGKSDDKARGKSEDKPRGQSEDAPGQAEDKQRGKSEDAPGHAEDKPRGKSDEAPRGNGKKPHRR